MVGRLVKDKHIASFKHHDRKTKLCSLAAAYNAHLFKNILACELHQTQQTSHLLLGHAPAAVVYLVNDSLAEIQLRIFLVKVGYLDIFVPLDSAVCHRHFLLDYLQKSGFSYAVCAHNTYLVPTAHIKGNIVRKSLIPCADVDVLHGKHIKGRFIVILELYLCLFLVCDWLFQYLHGFKLLHTALCHGGGGGTDNVSVNEILKLCDLRLLSLIFLYPALGIGGFKLGEFGVIALPAAKMSMLYLAYGGAELIKKISVMGNYEKCALIILQIVLQPHDSIKIQVVGRLIKDKQAGAFKEKLCHGKTCFFAAAEGGDDTAVGLGRKAHTVKDSLYLHIYEIALVCFKICRFMGIFGAYLVKMLFILMYLGACHFGFKSSQLVLNRKQL